MSSIGKGGAWKTLKPGSGGTGTAVGVGGAWKSVRAIWVGKDGAWKRFFVASTIAVSATNVNETDSGAAPSGQVAGSSTATPTGAQGPVSYFWEHVSTSSGNTPSIDANLSQSPTFTATVADAVNSVSTWKVTATDDVGSAEDTITVTLNWNDTSQVSVTDIAVDSSNPGAFCASGARFNDAGNIDEIGPATTDFTSIHNGEWWTGEPTANIGSQYEIRCQSLTSGTWSFQAAAVGTWVGLDTNPQWRVQVLAMASPTSKACDANFQIRRKSDNTIVDSFALSAFASN